MKNEELVPDTQKDILRKLPAGHYELKVSCDRPVTWSCGFSCHGIFIQVEWLSGLYSLRQVTEVKLGRVRSERKGR